MQGNAMCCTLWEATKNTDLQIWVPDTTGTELQEPRAPEHAALKDACTDTTAEVTLRLWLKAAPLCSSLMQALRAGLERYPADRCLH